jgi:microcystin-dependent protein
MSDTSFLSAGDYVESISIPSGTTVSAIDSATQITLSANATAGGSETIRFSPDPLGDGSTTFTLPDFSGSRYVRYAEDSATGNGVKISNLPEVTDVSDSTKFPNVEGSTTSYSTKANILKGTLPVTTPAGLEDSTSITVDCNNKQEQAFTLTSTNTTTAIDITNMVDNAALSVNITIDSISERTYNFTSTGLTCRVVNTTGAQLVIDNDVANQFYEIVIRRTGSVVKIFNSGKFGAI